MKKLIEIVCKGNIGRSPKAEMLARKYLQNVDALKEYGVISSGTEVDRIRSADYTSEELLSYVGICKKMGFNSFEVENLERALRTPDTEDLQALKERFLEHLISKELQVGERLMREMNLRGTMKHAQDQTVPRAEVIAVLPMDYSILPRVSRIYSSQGLTPTMAVLSTLATGEPRREITLEENPSSPQEFEESYRKAIKQMVEDTPKAIRKIIAA